MKNKNKNKIIAFTVLGVIALIGSYNAFVINSESHLSESKFLKRLDEFHGVTISGRQMAGSWQKLAHVKMGPKKSLPVVAKPTSIQSPEVAPTYSEVTPEAAVQETLALNLVEVINPKKYQNGAPLNSFNGSLATNNGVIESLTVSLPGSENLSVAFSEMSGNVFEYDFNGEIYSGMMYQVDTNAYMVTLTNGPLEGTRLRFSAETPAVEQQQTQEKLAENNVEVGTFGQEAPAIEAEVAPSEMVQNDVATQGFKF
jgi:hypothetical protein